MDATTFYGRKRVKDADAATSPDKAAKLKKIQFSILAPLSSLKKFQRQDAAISYRNNDDSLIVFAQEIGAGGVRQFLVANPEVFWEDYSGLAFRHYYEVIEAGRPCKLYFDLEYSVSANAGLDGPALVDRLLDLVTFHLQQHLTTAQQHQSKNFPTKDDILLLDSTSATKFSMHAIFPTVVFANNQAMGNWVKHVYSHLISPDDRVAFTLNKTVDNIDENGVTSASCCLIDLGVYTRNRNFRLYLSTKFGKAASLELAASDLFSIGLLEQHGGKRHFDLRRRIFLASLITWVDGPAVWIDWPARAPPATDDSSAATAARTNPGQKSAKCSGSASILGAGNASPFTEVDAFVRQLVDPGFVRKCTFFQESGAIIYEIGGTRYCGNIGREHRSNNVRFVCEVGKGVLYQRCHDPDCRDYRGPDIVIPSEILPWNSFTEEWQEDP